MASVNPFAEFRSECEKALADAFKKVFPEIQMTSLAFEKPSSPEHGQLASSLCLEFAKKVNKKPLDVAKTLIKNIDESELQLTEKIVPAGAGYINFHANFAKLADLTLESARKLDAEYGFAKTDKPIRIIVEHTSVNPLHPIHVGQARNPILGDAAARLLKARGHIVYRHYYVDDVGRQSSVIAYGYEKLGRPKPDEKPDHFIGKIYTITSCLIEINRLKKQLQHAKMVSAEEEIAKTNKDLDEWMSIAAELKGRYSDLFDALLEKTSKDEDPEGAISKLNRTYEAGDSKAERLVRGVSEICLDGFKETLSRIGVSYDSWDWEGDFVWSGHVDQVLRKLESSRYTHVEGGVSEFDAQKVIDELGLREKLGLREDHEVPPLTLARADGTTLYTTRDVAYTIWKFERADRVINVIGMEQNLAQLQLKIALHALGYGKYADNLIHFAYNLVTLPGYRMSSRRGHYITFDEVMDEAVKRAYEEVSKRSPHLPEEEKQKIADFVGIGAVRYSLVEVDTSKPVVFTWDRVLNFEKNSAPYAQYTHARACSIMRKAERKPQKPAYELLNQELEHEITLALATFPDTFIEAAEYLKPHLIADYANALSDKFNTFYNALPVIKAEPKELADARLTLVDAVRITLRNALNLIGILAPDKM
jgi:arginyl-tRNA synthetase